MDIVITTVNKITCSQFPTFPTALKLNGYQKQRTLDKFILVLTVFEFFHNSNCVFCDELRDNKQDIAYLSDLFTKFNVINFFWKWKEMGLNVKRSNQSSPPGFFLSYSYSNIAHCELFQLAKSRSLVKSNIANYI